MQPHVALTLPELFTLVSRVLVRFLEIRSVWSLDYAAVASAGECRELMLFADRATLHGLRACDDLQDAGVVMLVVVDGDAFESAWGTLSGSLGRSAWHQVSPDCAYFYESVWARPGADAGDVLRVRKKATLLWQSPNRSDEAARRTSRVHPA